MTVGQLRSDTMVSERSYGDLRPAIFVPDVRRLHEDIGFGHPSVTGAKGTWLHVPFGFFRPSSVRQSAQKKEVEKKKEIKNYDSRFFG